MAGKLSVAIILCWVIPTLPFAAAQEEAEKPRTYADPEGRFSFQFLGDWIKLRANSEKGIAGSFVFTGHVAGERRVIVELMITSAELKPPLSLEGYVKAEDRRAMNTPGFSRVGRQEKVTLGGQAALRNCYALSRRTGSQEPQQKLVHQYYALTENAVWGITLSALKQDEAVLAEVEKLLASTFRFSVPERPRDTAPAVFKKVTFTGSLGGFSLSVPEGWDVNQSEEHGGVIRGPEAVVYAFSLPEEAKEAPPQDAAGRFLKERENLKELRVLSQSTEEVAGLKGHVVEYSGVGEGRPWRVKLFTFLSGQKAFFVYCVAPEEGWQRNSEILMRIARSFSLAGPSANVEEDK